MGRDDIERLGCPYGQAGGHPGAIETTIEVDNHPVESQLGPTIYPDEPAKDVLTELPAGLAGNPTAFPQCTAGQLSTGGQFGFPRNLDSDLCPLGSIVGTSYVNVGIVTFAFPIYNMVPPAGVPARFSFNVLNTLVSLDAAAREDGEFHLGIDSKNIPQGVALTGARIVFWGNPYAASHDGDRCWKQSDLFGQISTSPHLCFAETGVSAPHSVLSDEVAFLTLPTRCTAAGEGLALRRGPRLLGRARACSTRRASSPTTRRRTKRRRGEPKTARWCPPTRRSRSSRR